MWRDLDGEDLDIDDSGAERGAGMVSQSFNDMKDRV